MENLITLSYRSLNSYLISCQGGMLLIDPGWPGTLPQLKSGLQRYQLGLGDIRYVLATHFHPDHAGLMQEIKNACGARLILHARQVPFVGQLAEYYRAKGSYVPIRLDARDLIVDDPTRPALAALGVAGELVLTPGHSADSVTLALDSGRAFVGDLPMTDRVEAAAYEATRASWEALAHRRVQKIYPAHAQPF